MFDINFGIIEGVKKIDVYTELYIRGCYYRSYKSLLFELKRTQKHRETLGLHRETFLSCYLEMRELSRDNC